MYKASLCLLVIQWPLSAPRRPRFFNAKRPPSPNGAPLTSCRAPLKGLEQIGLEGIKRSPSLQEPSAYLPLPGGVLSAKGHTSLRQRQEKRCKPVCHRAVRPFLHGILLFFFMHLETSELCKLAGRRTCCCCMTWEEVHFCLILSQVSRVELDYGLNMGSVSWSCAFYSAVSCLMLVFVDMKTGMCCSPPPLPLQNVSLSVTSARSCSVGTIDATLEGSSMGYLSVPYSSELMVVPGVIRVSDIKASQESHTVVSRRKRNILFPSGVKLCAQETAQQVVANHLSYFHLRGETWTRTRVGHFTPFDLHMKFRSLDGGDSVILITHTQRSLYTLRKCWNPQQTRQWNWHFHYWIRWR